MTESDSIKGQALREKMVQTKAMYETLEHILAGDCGHRPINITFMYRAGGDLHDLPITTDNCGVNDTLMDELTRIAVKELKHLYQVYSLELSAL